MQHDARARLDANIALVAAQARFLHDETEEDLRKRLAQLQAYLAGRGRNDQRSFLYADLIERELKERRRGNHATYTQAQMYRIAQFEMQKDAAARSLRAAYTSPSPSMHVGLSTSGISPDQISIRTTGIEPEQIRYETGPAKSPRAAPKGKSKAKIGPSTKIKAARDVYDRQMKRLKSPDARERATRAYEMKLRKYNAFVMGSEPLNLSNRPPSERVVMGRPVIMGTKPPGARKSVRIANEVSYGRVLQGHPVVQGGPVVMGTRPSFPLPPRVVNAGQKIAAAREVYLRQMSRLKSADARLRAYASYTKKLYKYNAHLAGRLSGDEEAHDKLFRRAVEEGAGVVTMKPKGPSDPLFIRIAYPTDGGKPIAHSPEYATGKRKLD